MPTKKTVENTVDEPKEKNQSQLMGLFRRVFLASIGAAAIAQEELEALINRLVERGELAEEDGKKLIHEMKDKQKTKTAQVEDDISKNIESTLKRMNIPSKADVDALSEKISALSKKIDELKKS